MGPIRPKIRLFVEPRLQAGAMVALSAEQSHYLLNVMRCKDGEALALFNGTDGEWLAWLQPAGKKKADARVEAQLRRHEAVPDMWYVFAPIKHGRIDFIVQKATELGAAALLPVMTARTIASRVKIERLAANAVEAAEQSGRTDVPSMHEPVSFSQLLADWPQDRILLYGDEAGRGDPPAELFATLPETGKWAVLVGPEGGFTQEEFGQLEKAGFAHAISLGPRILRADTAGLAALACLMAWRGDWNKKPKFEG